MLFLSGLAGGCAAGFLDFPLAGSNFYFHSIPNECQKFICFLSDLEAGSNSLWDYNCSYADSLNGSGWTVCLYSWSIGNNFNAILGSFKDCKVLLVYTLSFISLDIWCFVCRKIELIRILKFFLFWVLYTHSPRTAVGRRPGSERPLSVDGGRKDHSRRRRPERPKSVGDWGLKDRCLVMEVRWTVVGDEGLKDRSRDILINVEANNDTCDEGEIVPSSDGEQTITQSTNIVSNAITSSPNGGAHNMNDEEGFSKVGKKKGKNIKNSLPSNPRSTRAQNSSKHFND
ncbi:hypothetical protein MA16_Dca020265 [Dendrobium catenatum]|uniref:Uncharacterized protein n=1 Tax=Dendrobium catenatum TaxID=906689 RepID=A0A2I0WAZ5_9ASPA|nr:hypothetical protein MA16_Dca020265 [Dendrobium catenatum]